MLWLIAVGLTAAWFIGFHAFNVASAFAIVAILASVIVTGIALRGLEKKEI